MKQIEHLTLKLSIDPFDPEINFMCAIEYQKLNQTASAVSFYLRTAEYGYETHKELAYNSLLMMAKCFEDQNDRFNSVTNCILQAITINPERPEAYFLMSQLYERSSSWQECYTWAFIGLTKSLSTDLPVDVGFPGKYCLMFEQALSAWWIGRKEESILVFEDLIKNYDMREDYYNGCVYNLAKIKGEL